MATIVNKNGQTVDLATGQVVGQPNPTASPVGGAGAPPAFDINAIIAAFTQLAHQQGQQRQQQQHQFFQDTNALGATAQANSRPQGLTPQEDWAKMFAHPAGESLVGRPGYAPSPMSNEDAAIGASLPQPNAASLRAMPPQSPFIGQQPQLPQQQLPAPGVVPPTGTPAPKKKTGFRASATPFMSATSMPGFSF